MATDKKISELTVASALTGTETIEIVQGGANKQTTTQAIADLGGGGGTWGSITGTLSDQTDLYGYLRGTRTVTGASASVQTDDNSLIIFNSATPFNFTLDQLTASSKISFLNIGAGAVSFVNGSGVTTSGNTTLDGAVGNLYPTAVVFYHTATTPRVISGAADTIDLVTVSTAGGTITLDYALKQQRVFEGGASFATPKTIAESNASNARAGEASFNLTNVAAVLTFPSDFSMPATDTRWDDGAKTFTPDTTGNHVFTWVKYTSFTAMLVPNVFP